MNRDKIIQLLSDKNPESLQQGLLLLKSLPELLSTFLEGSYIGDNGSIYPGEFLRSNITVDAMFLSSIWRRAIAWDLSYHCGNTKESSTLSIDVRSVLSNLNPIFDLCNNIHAKCTVLKIDILARDASEEYLKVLHDALQDLFEKYTHLETLIINVGDSSYGEYIRVPQNIELLTNLSTLSIRGGRFANPPNFSNMLSLTSLSLPYCRVSKQWELHKLTTLEELTLCDHSSLSELPNISTLINIHTLILSSCTRFIKLPNLHKLTKLKKIDLARGYSLENIEGLKDCFALEKINLSHNKKLSHLNSLEKLSNLEDLDLSHSISIADGSSLLNLTKLKRVNIYKSEGIDYKTFPQEFVFFFRIERQVGDYTLCWKGPLRYLEDQDHHPQYDPHWKRYTIQSHWVEKDGKTVTPVITSWDIIQEERFYSSFYTSWHEGFVVMDDEIFFRGKAKSDYHNLNHTYYKLVKESGSYTRREYQKYLSSPVVLEQEIKGQYLPYSQILGFESYRRIPKSWSWDDEQKILNIGSAKQS